MLAGAGSGEVKLSLPIKKLDHQRDPLYVKVLMTEEFLLASFDATSMPPKAVDHFQEAASAKTGIPKENVIISMTHSFSAPHFNDDSNNAVFEQALYSAIEAVEMKETRIGFSLDFSDINVQRNIKTNDGWWIGKNPDGYSSRELKSIFFFHEEKPFACLINYDIQSSCVMAEDPTAVSADLPGAVSDIFRRKGITAFFLAGACADQAPVSNDPVQLAEKLTDAVSIPKPQVWDNAELSVSKVLLPMQKMKIPTRELTPHKEFEFEFSGEYASVPIVLLRLNDITLCMTSPELNSGYGILMQEFLPEKNMIVTMTNGAHKYLPQEWDFENITYEAMNTVLARGSDEIFLKAIEEELKK